jgi:hypothetical protein
VSHEVNVLALVKGKERFVFVYDDASQSLAIDAIRDAAADPEIGLNWFDAAVLTDRARQQMDSESGKDSEALPSRIRDVLPG